jgi:DNA-binding NtrC family response regulator
MKPLVQPATSPVVRDSVLLVDDEMPLLDVYLSALGPRFDCATATSAREAEFLLREGKFKVVIADHLMPGGNGLSFLMRAREEHPHLQRILITGYMNPEILLQCVNEAALFRYLLKPVPILELIRVTEEAVHMYDRSTRAVDA